MLLGQKGTKEDYALLARKRQATLASLGHFFFHRTHPPMYGYIIDFNQSLLFIMLHNNYRVHACALLFDAGRKMWTTMLRCI